MSNVHAVCRLIFEDEKTGVHLYNAVNDQLLHLEEISMGLTAALWDTMDPNAFLLSDGQMLLTYLYSPNSLMGTGKHDLLVMMLDLGCPNSLVLHKRHSYCPSMHVHGCDPGMHTCIPP